MQSPVVCVHCGLPIETLDDLIIRSISYNMHALHKNCYQSVRSKWIYKISWSLRGWPFWIYLLTMNSILVLCLLIFPDSWHDLRWFFLIVNIPQGIFRAIAFFSYELPLRN